MWTKWTKQESMIVTNLRTYTYYINIPPSDDDDEYQTVFVNVFVRIGNVIKINACALGHKLPIYQLFKGVVCDFFDLKTCKVCSFRWQDERNGKHSMRSMKTGALVQWRQSCCLVLKLSGHLNSYCQRVQKFKIQCRNVFQRHLLEILSRMYIYMYTSIVKVELLK